MKRTPLLFAALVPFAAAAGQSMGVQEVDQQELRDDLQVTSILGSEIQSSDGQQLGSVEDVILSADGNVISVIVQREGEVAETADDMRASAERGMDEAQSRWDEATTDEDAGYADTGETGTASQSQAQDERGMDMGLDPDRAGSTEMGDDFAKLDWSSVSFDPEEEILRVTGSESSLQPVEYDQTEDMQQLQGEIRASKLVGLEVNLADEDSFGEVEDVMIDPAQGKASAIVVDSMEFFDKERYALPVDLNGINAEEEELTLQYTQQQIKDMGQFDMDAVTEGT
ncbi:MAG TPA: PRC-barrel domain-containing protein [Gammaproteobacteria bacterium]